MLDILNRSKIKYSGIKILLKPIREGLRAFNPDFLAEYVPQLKDVLSTRLLEAAGETMNPEKKKILERRQR